MSVFKYRIAKIRVLEFNASQDASLNDLKLTSSFGFKVSFDECVVGCLSQFEYKTSDDTVMYLSLECVFKVEENCFRGLIKDGVLTIPTDMLQYMASIAVGTARGEIHARCEQCGSTLQDVVLPPLNLTEIIKAPSEFLL